MAGTDPYRTDGLNWASPPLRARIAADPAGVLRDRGINVPADLPAHLIHEVIRIVSLLWVEGSVIGFERFHIDPFDEGLLFGRGVWESTRTIYGEPWLWTLHLDRLKRTAALLNIDVDEKRLPTAQQVSDYVRSLSLEDVIVRLNVTAGRRGMPGLVWMSAWLPQVEPPTIRLQTCRSPVEKGQPYLLWKTFQYATRLRTGQEAVRAGFDSALLLDDKQCVLEAAHANIFVRFADGWVTPPADGGLLPGTVRHFLLENSPLPMREEIIPKAKLAEAREIFVTNSNVGLIPVSLIDDRKFDLGPETQSLHRWLPTSKAMGMNSRLFVKTK